MRERKLLQSRIKRARNLRHPRQRQRFRRSERACSNSSLPISERESQNAKSSSGEPLSCSLCLTIVSSAYRERFLDRLVKPGDKIEEFDPVVEVT